MTERRYAVLDPFEFHAIAGDDVDLPSKTVATLQLIKDKCHTILLTRELKNEYWKRAREIEKGKSKIHVDIRLLEFVKNLLVDRDKVEEVEYLPGGQELEFLRKMVPEKDLPIVRAALSKPATSVVTITTDKRHLVDNEALKAYLKRMNPSIGAIHLSEYVKLNPLRRGGACSCSSWRGYFNPWSWGSPPGWKSGLQSRVCHIVILASTSCGVPEATISPRSM